MIKVVTVIKQSHSKAMSMLLTWWTCLHPVSKISGSKPFSSSANLSIYHFHHHIWYLKFIFGCPLLVIDLQSVGIHGFLSYWHLKNRLPHPYMILISQQYLFILGLIYNTVRSLDYTMLMIRYQWIRTGKNVKESNLTFAWINWIQSQSTCKDRQFHGQYLRSGPPKNEGALSIWLQCSGYCILIINISYFDMDRTLRASIRQKK
jgi:hypothetical protein